ncbi:MAG TPA: GntR family transcriptional regulator [Myxococcota bacterium]|nr:GntR family transcriptional regulator [Myxococcota bacterium]
MRPASGLPLYRQLIQQIERLSAAGGLREGDPLPSVRELSRDLGVNPATVVRAYTELERAGLVETRRGLGTFVAKRGAGLQRAERVRRLRGAAEALVVEAHHLGLSEEDVHDAVDQAAVLLHTRQRSDR